MIDRIRVGARRAAGRWYRLDQWPPEVLALLGAWVCTRLLYAAPIIADMAGQQYDIGSLYPTWAAELAHGQFPWNDVTWQYPPVAGLVFLAPRALPFLSYQTAFGLFMLLCDAAVLVMLLAAARGAGRARLGVWVWVLGLPLLGELPYVRFDPAVTVLAVGSVLLLRRSSTGGGILAGLGALVKAWPLLMLIGAPRGRATRRSWFVAGLSCVVLVAVIGVFFTHEFSFLGEQGARGIEIESLPGCALMVAHLFGYSSVIQYSYGSYQISGAYSGQLATLTLALSAVGFLWLLWWRLRARVWTSATTADAAFTSMLVFVTTSRVISPQYFIWLLGLAATCLLFRTTSQRVPALAMLPLTVFTTLDYPVSFGQVLQGEPAAIMVVVVRNLGLLWVTVHSAIRLRRSTRPAPDAATGTTSAIPAQREPSGRYIRR
ncbi:glycosyltransferase 87 family protein [Streptacidiphilus sp. P02-A3a]|uniref:glycosyltransferase 87 family protein n=1 Tax=Streptacidiphilus sp. P02-A3a TaxID=2704468 RepID=UPI0015FD484C|nr:glycosyltransferase 87 family protein [Streptacidiphilus sp. P02-A3a]QMU72940.1 DUF2029 domain-containing protein [Streptacidiphilus sp. P02-A3a]